MRMGIARVLPIVVLAGWWVPEGAAAQVLTGKNAIWNFRGAPDGAVPLGEPAVDSKSDLFVTTSQGGANNYGAVVELMPPAGGKGAWSERVIYSFEAGSDGASPHGAVLVLNDTTLVGTAGGGSVLWQLTSPDDGQDWEFSVLANGFFSDLVGDVTPGPGGTLYTPALETLLKFTPPAAPGGAWSTTALGEPAFCQDVTSHLLVDQTGAIYGSCTVGGIGYGIVFKYTPAPTIPFQGVTQVLWEFGGLNDGASPSGGLSLGPDGALYGTTTTGLGPDTFNGTIFRLAPPAPGGSVWSESVIAIPPTGEQVQGPVAFDRSGNVFAATTYLLGHPQGEVFHAAPNGDGTYSTVVDGQFTRASGIAPASGVIWSHGVLYGTTQAGGSAGLGTVVALRPR
jgi:hypothetical protein